MRLLSIIVFSIILFGACYSFTGGTIPPHIKTLQIATVIDQSGFGNPQYKIDLETALKDGFSRDNSFEIIDLNADAILTVSILSINETTNTVSSGELETEKRITLSCSVEYYDNVNKTQIFKKSFSSYGLFDINQAFTSRTETISVIIEQISEDILLGVVSG